MLRTWFFPEFFDFRRCGPESGANGFLKAFRFFAGGNGVARREIQKKQGFGVVGSLFMMRIFGECHSGMGNVVVFRVEIGYPGFNLLFPSGRHAHVPTFNFDVHHFPHRLSFISRGFNVLPSNYLMDDLRLPRLIPFHSCVSKSSYGIIIPFFIVKEAS